MPLRRNLTYLATSPIYPEVSVSFRIRTSPHASRFVSWTRQRATFS